MSCASGDGYRKTRHHHMRCEPVANMCALIQHSAVQLLAGYADFPEAILPPVTYPATSCKDSTKAGENSRVSHLVLFCGTKATERQGCCGHAIRVEALLHAPYADSRLFHSYEKSIRGEP